MTKDYGNLELTPDQEWNNPCDDFLEMKKDPELGDKDGVSAARLRDLKRVIRDGPQETSKSSWESWQQFVSDWKERGDPDSDKRLTTHDGIEYYNHLLDAGLSKNTIHSTHMKIVRHFLEECMKRGVVDANPAAFVLDNTDSPESNKDYPEITVKELGNFLGWIPDPQMRAGYVMMAKTAIRIGETLNIDLPYLHLEHPIYYDYIETKGIELHEKVKDTPDSVLIPSEPEAEEKFRGEERKSGNKTKKGKLLPIDRETKRVILDWLVMRPNTGYPYPLFYGKRDTGRPRSQNWLRSLKSYLREYGLAVDYVEDDDKNMDLHYFRHFFSTNMQDGEGTYDGANWNWSKVQIIRGDIGGGRQSNRDNQAESNGLQKTYTHRWGDLIRLPYLNDIYNFGIYD
jgi:integrase